MKKTIHAEHFFFCAFSDSESVVKHVTCMGDTEFPLAPAATENMSELSAGKLSGKYPSHVIGFIAVTDSEVEEKVLISRQGPCT